MRLIPLDEIPEWLPTITTVLDHFVRDVAGYNYRAELQRILSGEYRVWYLGPESICVTQIIQRPGAILWVPWLYAPNKGDELDTMVYNGLVDHARELNCEAIEFAIRPGFGRSKWAKKFDRIYHVADLCRIDMRVD